MEDSLEQMGLVMEVNIFKNLNDSLDEIKNHCHMNPFVEICGFLGYDINTKQYIVQFEKNCSSEPKYFFAIDALKYLLFKQKHTLAAVFHSHIAGDEKPSEFDIKMSENCCIPFLVYGLNTNKFEIYKPKNIEYDVNILEEIKINL